MVRTNHHPPPSMQMVYAIAIPNEEAMRTVAKWFATRVSPKAESSSGKTGTETKHMRMPANSSGRAISTRPGPRCCTRKRETIPHSQPIANFYLNIYPNFYPKMYPKLLPKHLPKLSPEVLPKL